MDFVVYCLRGSGLYFRWNINALWHFSPKRRTMSREDVSIQWLRKLLIHPLWWALFACCGFVLSTFALRHCWSTGWVRATTLTGFTPTGTTRFAVDPVFTLIVAEPLPETVTFCHFSCCQYCSSLHQLYSSGQYALIFMQMFWALLVSPWGNRHHALAFPLLASYS